MRREEDKISKSTLVGPGRREEEPRDAKIVLPPDPPVKVCRCPYCGYSVTVESGTRCKLMDCCGHGMRG